MWLIEQLDTSAELRLVDCSCALPQGLSIAGSRTLAEMALWFHPGWEFSGTVRCVAPHFKHIEAENVSRFSATNSAVCREVELPVCGRTRSG